MSKISPAPWHWGIHESHGDDSAGLESLIDAEGNEVMWLGDSARYDPRSGYEPELPDRQVLAAAPELLEALERLVADFESEIHDSYDGTNKLDARLSECDYARAAIAKARGKS